MSAHAGIESHAKIGDRVEAGQALFTLFSEDEALIEEPYRMMEATVQIAEERRERLPLVREVVSARANGAIESAPDLRRRLT